MWSTQVPSTELHLKEKWFHGKLASGRPDAERLLADYQSVNGSFLVRESATFTGDYSLSFAWVRALGSSAFSFAWGGPWGTNNAFSFAWVGGGGLGPSAFSNTYCGTLDTWTPLGNKVFVLIQRWPLLRDCFVHTNCLFGTWVPVVFISFYTPVGLSSWLTFHW